MAFTVLDIILLIPLVYGFARGLYRGLISELASLTGLIGGILLAFYFSEDVYQKLARLVENPGIEVRVASFIIVFIVVIIIIRYISKAITKVINFLSLGVINYLLGGLFGLSKWLLVLLVAVYFLDNMQEDSVIFQPHILEESRIYQALSEYSLYLSEYIDEASGMTSKKGKRY